MTINEVLTCFQCNVDRRPLTARHRTLLTATPRLIATFCTSEYLISVTMWYNNSVLSTELEQFFIVNLNPFFSGFIDL